MAITALPLCGLMFRCGCSLAHGAHLCSIHHAMGPQCPWCVERGKAFGFSFLAVVTVVAASLFVLARWRKPIWVGSIVGVAVYLIVAIAAGWMTAKVMDYPTWFGWAN